MAWSQDLFSAQTETGIAWVGTPRQFGWLESIVKAVLVLNLLDAVLTVLWISTGRAVEANPFLRDLVTDFPVAFVLVKMSLVSLGTIVLWRHRTRPLAVVAVFVAFVVYYLLFLYHLNAFDLRLMQRFFG